MCISPIFIPNRTHGLSLSRDKGDILSSFVAVPDYDKKRYNLEYLQQGVYVPCGKCPECIKSRQNVWYSRFELEKTYWSKKGCFCYFCTFTYNNENLPKTREQAVLDVQAFMKNMSRTFGFKPRYYLTSEFGSKYNRLHFHALIFNVPNIVSKDTVDGLLRKCWHRGFISASYAAGKEFSYVTKYVTKDVVGFEGSWRPIQVYSKRPMLGLPAGYDKALSKYLNVGDNQCLHFRGFTYPVPRALRNKLVDVGVLSRRYADFLLKRGIKHGFSIDYCNDVITEYELKKKSYELKKKLNIKKRESLCFERCEESRQESS